MWNLLKKIIRKKSKMENVEEIDIELLDKELSPFLYKWTKGDNDGQVCEYENLFRDATSGIVWINFKDGSRINYDLMNDYMMQVDPSSIVNQDQLSLPVNNTLQSSPIRNVMVSDNQPKNKVADNPIVSLLQKQKPNWVEVSINLKLNLPTKNLYNVLSSSFDDAEDEIIEFVVRDLDIEVIKDSLRINIKDIYKGNGAQRKSGTNSNTKDQE